MRVLAGGLHTGMAECRLHQADRRARVQGMARMRMAQPVRRDLRREACSLCSRLHDAEDLHWIEWPALLAAQEDRRSRISPMAV